MLPVLPPNPILYYGLLTCALLLGTALMALAWWRPRTRQRGARMLAGAVAAGALWLAAFPPLRQLPAARAEAILLTDGYAPDTLRQLLRRLGTGTPVWYHGGATAPTRARPLASLLTLAEARPALRRLHVLGQGVPVAELPILGRLPVRLHPGVAFAGLQTAFWPAKTTLGERLQVAGTVVAPATSRAAGTPAWVVLQAAGAGRDSVRLPTGGGAFRLHYQPKATGLALYSLLLRRPGQPLAGEPVPVEIIAPPLPAVLLLTATPAFEFKFLRNYLAEAHYPVALRTTVSRGLVQTDFVNQPALALDRLTPALLAHFSVLVVDAATLATMSAAETQALQTAMSAGRLGVVTLAEAAPLPRTAPARTDFAVQARPATLGTTLALSWPTQPGEARAALPAQLRAAPMLRPLITGPNRALLAASRRVGLGFAVVSVVPETFRWALQGHPLVYASFWNQLLTAAVPPAPSAAGWRLSTRWPRPAQPLALHLAAAFPTVQPAVFPQAGGPPIRLALRQDTRLPEWSTAPFWPGAAGWHQVRGPGRTAYNFYVYPAAAWPGPALAERQQAAAQRAGSAMAAPTAQDTVAEPWPAGWFFGLFLLAAGYLWLEEKL